MKAVALLTWVLLLWIMASLGGVASAFAQQAGPAGAPPAVPGRHARQVPDGKLSLTPQQRDWLSRHDGRIRVGITVIPPQVLRSGGRYKGLSIDYIRLMERKLGCRFQQVPFPTWNAVILAAKTRRIDMIFAAQQTPDRRQYLLFTQPYIELPNMIVVRKDREGGADLKNMKGWRVAVSEGSAVQEFLKRKFAYLDLVPVPDELTGLIKVSIGEVDAMVVEISRASYYIEKSGILNLRVSGSAGLLYRLRFAVRSDWPILADILDKGLASITDEEKRNINRRWIIVGQRRVFASRALWIALMTMLAVVILAAIGSFVWNRTLRRVVRQRTSQLQQELADRRRTEDALHRLNRQLRAISRCNQVQMQASDEQTLLADICRIICDEAGYRMAWVGYAQNDDAKTIRPMAWAGVEEGYLAEARITWSDKARGRGPAGQAIRAGVSACIQDFTVDPQAASWREIALRRGYRSSTALPLKENSAPPFGVLCIYSTAPGTFTPEEMKLLDELAGNLAFGISVLRTRTARRQADQEVALLSFALNNVREAAFLIDENARFTYVNEESCRVLGYTRDELLTLGVADVDPDFPMERWSDHWRELADRHSMTFEGRHKTKDGCILPVEINANYIEYGQKRYDLALVRDITERKRMERELISRERRYRTLLESVPDFIVRYDSELRRIYVNPAWEKASGLSAREVIGVDYTDIPRVPRAAAYEYIQKLRLALQNGTSQTAEFTWVNAYGVNLFLEYIIVPEYDHHGKIAGVLAVGRDITERKQAEEELARYREQLEELVRERTMELKSANEELEAFAYSVSHDLRAPLRHIDGFIELLQKKAERVLDTQGRHYMDNISDAARKMGLLIDDLLSFSRMGRQAMAFKPVDLGNLVRDVIRELGPDAAGRDIAWRISDLPAVSGDASLLRMVLNNLIANALKFTRPRRKAHIEIGSMAGKNAEFVIFVRDNGVGFDMTYAGNLFGVFQRLHREEDFEGTGIGLANVRRIIARHGGRTWAEGQPDGGAAFYFTLPNFDQKPVD